MSKEEFARVIGKVAKPNLRLFAIFLALLSALGRGGWEIQTFKGDTVVERVDRAMYKVGQLGAAVLLILIMTAK